MRLLTKLSILIPLLSCGNQALANEEDDFSFAIMPVVFNQESIYDGGKSKTGFFPLPELRWKNVFFASGKLGFTALKYKTLSLDLSIAGDYMGDTDRGDSKKLKDMKKLKTVLTANADLNYSGKIGDINLGIAQDISNEHKGYSLSAGYSYNIELGRFFIEPSVSVTYASKDVADYYYGVSKEDVLIGRPAYDLEETVNYDVSLTAGYALDERSMIMGFASMTVYDDDIEDSPIITDNKAMTYGLGYRYQF